MIFQKQSREKAKVRVDWCSEKLFYSRKCDSFFLLITARLQIRLTRNVMQCKFYVVIAQRRGTLLKTVNTRLYFKTSIFISTDLFPDIILERKKQFPPENTRICILKSFISSLIYSIKIYVNRVFFSRFKPYKCLHYTLTHERTYTPFFTYNSPLPRGID